MMIVFKLKKRPPSSYNNLGFVHLKDDYYVYGMFTPSIPYSERVEKFRIKRVDLVHKYMKKLQKFLRKNLVDVKIINAENQEFAKVVVDSILHLMGFKSDVVSPMNYHYLMCYSVLFQDEFEYKLHFVRDGNILVPVSCDYFEPYLKKFQSAISMMTKNPPSNGWVVFPSSEKVLEYGVKPFLVHKFGSGELYFWPLRFVGACVSYAGRYIKVFQVPAYILFPLVNSMLLVKLFENGKFGVIEGIRKILMVLPRDCKCNELGLDMIVSVRNSRISSSVPVIGVKNLKLHRIHILSDEMCKLLEIHVKRLVFIN